MSILLDKQYNKGFNDGTQYGMKAAKKAVAEDFLERLFVLRNTPGIGPKTWEKIIEALDLNNQRQGE